MKKQLINPPPPLHEIIPFGMSQAVMDAASATVYGSSQVDWYENNEVCMPYRQGATLDGTAIHKGVLCRRGVALIPPDAEELFKPFIDAADIAFKAS